MGGRVLFLADDAELIRRQLHEGADLELTPDLEAKLRDQISTDEITPAYICFFYDETLGEFPYLGLEVAGAKGKAEAPIERGTVKAGGFVCSVAGKRRGKGSSREQSPYAELMAGIKVVVSESIERIYNENCQNLGILTTTDFGLIERIRSGEPIPLSEFTARTDDITRQIIEYGGLFEFNMARLQGRVTLPVPLAEAPGSAANGSRPAFPRPMPVGEKIFARKLVVDASTDQVGTDWVRPGEAGFFRTDIRFSHEYVTPMAAIFFEQKMGADAKVLDPESVLFFRDHLTFLHKVMSQERIEQGL
ncbi:MAG: 3-isopropylmalate dehydratase, partial [Gemmatimonadota bacterium]|nr:3-isopropylmalate dehydratase [Gemmatimonadota bacterium]